MSYRVLEGKDTESEYHDDPDMTSTFWMARRPFYWSPDAETIWLGQPGVHHADVGGEFSFREDPIDMGAFESILCPVIGGSYEISSHAEVEDEVRQALEDYLGVSVTPEPKDPDPNNWEGYFESKVSGWNRPVRHWQSEPMGRNRFDGTSYNQQMLAVLEVGDRVEIEPGFLQHLRDNWGGIPDPHPQGVITQIDVDGTVIVNWDDPRHSVPGMASMAILKKVAGWTAAVDQINYPGKMTYQEDHSSITCQDPDCSICAWLKKNQKRAMAERSGDPELDQLIQEFEVSEWEGPVDWEPVNTLRIPNAAEGQCGQISLAFERFLSEQGIEATTESDPSRDDHAYTIVKMPTGTYAVDWSAAQFGEREFPHIQREDESGWQREWTSATVEDTEPEFNFGFLTEPYDKLYPCLWDRMHMRPEARKAIKKRVLDALKKEFDEPDRFLYFTMYGSGASYNWSEEGDADVQIWVDIDKYSGEEDHDSESLVAAVRLALKDVNFPTCKELGLERDDCAGHMLIQFYAKPGTGSKEENLAQKPYACYDLETTKWLVKPKPITPEFYAEGFEACMQAASDIAIQAEAAIGELQRYTVNWKFWKAFDAQGRDAKKEITKSEKMAGKWKDAVHELFIGVFKGRQEAYGEGGKGMEDERDLVQKLLEVWGIFQKLKHHSRADLPWETTAAWTTQEMRNRDGDLLHVGERVVCYDWHNPTKGVIKSFNDDYTPDERTAVVHWDEMMSEGEWRPLTPQTIVGTNIDGLFPDNEQGMIFNPTHMGSGWRGQLPPGPSQQEMAPFNWSGKRAFWVMNDGSLLIEGLNTDLTETNPPPHYDQKGSGLMIEGDIKLTSWSWQDNSYGGDFAAQEKAKYDVTMAIKRAMGDLLKQGAWEPEPLKVGDRVWVKPDYQVRDDDQFEQGRIVEMLSNSWEDNPDYGPECLVGWETGPDAYKTSVIPVNWLESREQNTLFDRYASPIVNYHWIPLTTFELSGYENLTQQERQGWSSRAVRHNDRAKQNGAIGGVTGKELWALVKRFEYNCAYCGVHLEYGTPNGTFDHIYSLALGGSGNIDNIVPACQNCNRELNLWDQRLQDQGGSTGYAVPHPEFGGPYIQQGEGERKHYVPNPKGILR